MKSKRLLAIFLVLTMLVSLMPVGFAADADEPIVDEEEEVIVEEEVAEEEVAEEEVVEEPTDYTAEDESSQEAQDYDINPPKVSFYSKQGDAEPAIEITNLASESRPTPTQEDPDATTVYYWVSETDLAKAQAAVSNPGHTFKAWSAPVGYDDAWTAGDKNVWATWDAENYSLTFVAEPKNLIGNKFPVNVAEVPCDGKIEDYMKDSSGTPVAGNDFDVTDCTVAFKVNGEAVASFGALQTYQVKGNTTVTVTWTSDAVYDVKFDYAGSTDYVGQPDADGVVTVKVPFGGTIPATGAYNPNPTKEGSTFKAWTPGSTEYKLDTPVTSVETFTATFDKNEFEVKFDGYPDATQTVKYGGYATAPADPAPQAGQQFSGWSLKKGDKDQIKEVSLYEIKEATTFYPIFGVKTYNVSFVDKENNQLFVTQKVEEGKKATDPGDPGVFGYHVTGWKVNGAGQNFNFSTAITADTRLVAQLEGNTYQLVIDTKAFAKGEWVKYAAAAGVKPEPLKNPVATFDFSDTKQSFSVGQLYAQGYEIAGFEYTKVGDTKATPVNFNTEIVVSEAAKLPLEADGNTYTLTLAPKISSSFWEVDLTSAHGDIAAYAFQTFARTNTTKKIVEPEIVKEASFYNDSGTSYYMEGWYEVTTPQVFTADNRWDINTPVTRHVSLVAHWLPVQTVTFTLNDHTAVWDASEGVEEDVWTVVRTVPYGMTLAAMAEVQKTHTSTLPTDTYKFTLPKATKVGSSVLTWQVDGKDFTAASEVKANLNAIDVWNSVKVTVTFDKNGGNISFNPKVEVDYNDTVTEPAPAPTKAGAEFDAWYYTKADGTKAEFIFKGAEGAMKVTEPITLTAGWKEFEAFIGDDNYETLEAAVDAAADGDVIGLYRDVDGEALTVSADVTFDFGDYTLTGATITVGEQSTLTIKSGSFDNCTFKGDGTVSVIGGTFHNDTFTVATVTVSGGKFDAASARSFNNKLVLADADKMLALVGTDGIYTAVNKVILTFDYHHSYDHDEDQEPTAIDNVVIYAGAGETAAHAIAETVERGKLPGGVEFKDNVTNPTFPDDKGDVSDKFDKWTVGGKAFDLSQKVTATATVTGTWVTRYKVTFAVDGRVPSGVGFEEYTQYIEAGKYATTVDPSGVISQNNKSKAPAYKEEFECWGYYDNSGNWVTFDFSKTAITKPVELEARMKCRLVFDYQDASKAPVVIQAVHGSRIGDYDYETLAPLPAGSTKWVDRWSEPLNETEFIGTEAWNEVFTFYPLQPKKTTWTLTNAEDGLASGFAYTVDATTGVGTVTYSGDADAPILIDQWGLIWDDTSVQYIVPTRADPNTVDLSFNIEAPYTVKPTDVYQIQVNDGAWTDFVWDDTSINNNMVVNVSRSYSVDEIKTAAKNHDTLDFTFAIRAKGTTETVASYFVSVDPQYVKFVFNVPTITELRKFFPEINEDEYYDLIDALYSDGEDVFLISNYVYQTAVSFDTDGGKPATIAPVTKDYGLPFVEADLNKNIVKDYSTFTGWDDEQGKQVYVVTGGVFTPFLMTEAVTLTAQYDEETATVRITNGDNTTIDSTSYKMSDPLSDLILPEPVSVEGKTFVGWRYVANGGTANPNYVVMPDAEGKTIGDIGWKNASGKKNGNVYVTANYVPNDTVTFMLPGEDVDPIVVGEPAVDNKGTIITYPASKFYTDEAKAAEATIPHFQYWTVSAPNGGGYASAPTKYDFDKATNVVKANSAEDPANIELYPYTTPIKVTFMNGEQKLAEGTLLSGQTLEEGIEAGTVTVPKVNVPAGQDYYWTDAEPSTWTKDIPAGYDPTTVPEDDVVLYAFAHSDTVEVTFYTAMGARGIVATVSFGEPIPEKAYPTVSDPNFKGVWSTVAYGTQTFPQAFDKTTKIIEATSLWAVIDAEEELNFEFSLNLQEQIGIRTKITLPDGADASKYTVNLDFPSPYQTSEFPKSMSLSSIPVRDGKYDFFPVYAGSDEMTYDLTITITKDGKEVGKKVVSIASVAEEKMKEERTIADPALMLIYKTLLQYGYYAQEQFQTHLDKLPTIPEGTTLSTIPSSYAVPDVEGFRISPGLDSAVTMWIKVKPAEGLTISDYSFKITKGNAVVTPDIAPKMVSGEIWVGLYLWSDFMNDDYVITVTAKGESATYTRCMDNALYNYQAKGTAVQIAQALYTYSEAVDAYFNA